MSIHPFHFRDLNLRQAEEALVAGVLDHEYALRVAARELGAHPFRSECAFELDKYYVSLINMFVSGCYNEMGNREALALAYPEDAFRVEDDLFDGNTAVPEYVDALVEALREVYDTQDMAVRAARALTETAIYLVPGSPPSAPRPLRRPKPPDEGGGTMRGLNL